MENLRILVRIILRLPERGQAGMPVLLNVEVSDVECVVFDEFAPRLYRVAH